MASAEFDPCRQWLGIDAVDLGDPRRLLGLLPTESDPLIVLRAAEARISLLKGIAPGPFDMARNALLKRVEEAREAVLAQIAATPRPPAPVGTAFAMPPPPAGAVPRPSVPDMPAVLAVPMVPSAVDASPWKDPSGGDAGGFVTVKTRPVYRKQSNGSGILLLAMAALLVAASVLVGLKLRPLERSRKREVAEVIVAPAAERDVPKEAAKPKRIRPPRERDPDDTTSDDAVSTSRPPKLDSPMVRPRPKPEPETTPEPETSPEPEPEPGSKPEFEPAPESKPSRDPTASIQNPANEPDDSRKPDAPPAPDDEAAKEIAALLADAFAALQERDFDAASSAVKAAAKKTDRGPLQDRIASWDSLITYAEGFNEYRRQAVAAAGPGLEYEVDGKQVAIVENENGKFIYRMAGRNKTTPSDKIPGAIVMAIIMEWFDGKPANQLFIGAYHATKPEPDLDKARSCWKQAEAGGADADALLLLLEDPVLLKAAAEESEETE